MLNPNNYERTIDFIIRCLDLCYYSEDEEYEEKFKQLAKNVLKEIYEFIFVKDEM